jgi:8-oxo-dGTP diphosphatase
MAAYRPILATLAYVMSRDGSKVLLIHRNKNRDDIHYGKYNGLGGKLEVDEDIIEGLKREIFEEAGIYCNKIRLRGTISWPGFGKNGEHWFGFIFRIDGFSGEPKKENPEGTLKWMPVADLDKIDLWESDRFWLDRVFSREDATFHGVAPFENGRLLSWSCTTI